MAETSSTSQIQQFLHEHPETAWHAREIAEGIGEPDHKKIGVLLVRLSRRGSITRERTGQYRAGEHTSTAETDTPDAGTPDAGHVNTSQPKRARSKSTRAGQHRQPPVPSNGNGKASPAADFREIGQLTDGGLVLEDAAGGDRVARKAG